MNIQHRMPSSQAIGVPSIHVQDQYSRNFDGSYGKSLPRAIPNARDDSIPGIPSMEAPPQIFGDHRQQLPRLPSLAGDIPSLSNPSRPMKSGIQTGFQSLKEGYMSRARDHDQMDIDGDQPSRFGPHDHFRQPAGYGKNRYASAPVQNLLQKSPEMDRDTMNWNVTSQSRNNSISTANDNLKSEGSMQEVVKRAGHDYDSNLLRKLTSPVSAVSLNSAGGSSGWPETSPIFPRAGERHNSTISLPGNLPESLSAPPSATLPSISSYSTAPASPLFDQGSQWGHSPSPYSSATSPHPSLRSSESQRMGYSPMMEGKYGREFQAQHEHLGVDSDYDDRRPRGLPSMGYNNLRGGNGQPSRRSPEQRSPSYQTDDDVQMEDMQDPHGRRLSVRTDTPPNGAYRYPQNHKSYPSPRREKRRHPSPQPDQYMGSEPTRLRYMPEHLVNDPNRITISGRPGFKSQSNPAPPSSSRYQIHTLSSLSSLASSQSSAWSHPYSSVDHASSVTSLSPASDMGASGSAASGKSYMNASPNTNRAPSSGFNRGHSRTVSEAVARQQASESAVGPKHHSAPKMLTALMCECCPKKPKKFETQLDLQMHELEKQFICKYCPHRFKNKNEAERHQNSLHLRKHSWSCNALSGVEAAFHPSAAKPHLIDICGYCGEEFANPPDWDIRVDHLANVHKFGECNQQKKFFRADHFRQHLKHSHAGTSGKWANILENACRQDEPGGMISEED